MARLRQTDSSEDLPASARRLMCCIGQAWHVVELFPPEPITLLQVATKLPTFDHHRPHAVTRLPNVTPVHMPQAAPDDVEIPIEALHVGQEFVDAAGQLFAAVCITPTENICHQADALPDPLAIVAKTIQINLEATLHVACLPTYPAVMPTCPGSSQKQEQRRKRCCNFKDEEVAH